MLDSSRQNDHQQNEQIPYLTNVSIKDIVRILFLTLKYNIYIIHMGVALGELCLLGNKTQMWPSISKASLESLNDKNTKVLAWGEKGGKIPFYLLKMLH